MQQDSNLGKWIREKWRTQVAFAEKLGVHQGRLSKWLGGAEGISDDYQTKIRKLGYTGPWPQEEAREAVQAPAGDYVTREDYWKLIGRVETLERAFERLGEIVRDLVRESQERPQAGRT